MMLNEDRYRKASLISSLLVAKSAGENCATNALSCSRVGEITISMSLVARGTPWAELAKEPVTKYGIPAASRAALNFSKTSLTLNSGYRCRTPRREMSDRPRAQRIPGDDGVYPPMWSAVQLR